MKLEAGRELDVRVAEAIGYILCPSKILKGRYRWRIPDGIYLAGYVDEKTKCHRNFPPCYSTDIAAAMGEPWEWLHNRHGHLVLTQFKDDGVTLETFHGFVLGEGSSIPEAICVAVLATKEEK